MSLSRFENQVEASQEFSDRNDCDSDSAKALKRILELLDDLNKRDLRLLDEIIDRLLCSRC